LESVVGSAKKILSDYKPGTGGRAGRVRRVPWFVAGAGIPLICVAFMAPESQQSQLEADNAAPEVAAVVAVVAEEQNLPVNIAPAALVTANRSGEQLQLKVRRGDSLDRLFRRNDLSLADLSVLSRTDSAKRHLRLVKPGDQLDIQHEDGEILSLTKDISISESLVITRVDDNFQTEIVERPLEVRQIQANGVINSSLFGAAASAGVSDRTIMNLAGIFAWDIDFVLDIRQGDEFSVIYEELWQKGKKVAEGNILAVEFTNQGEHFRAVRFEDPSGRADYFTPDGHSVRKAFVRAPLSFSRISSNFNPNRRHPKLNTIRAHKGVDYAAPSGTPVKAAGDGKVIFRGRKGGYGNAIIVQHGGNITTLYAHLSRFSKARNGNRVRQGDIIGYVGSTGLATGPHLHYEYRRNGVHLNPRTVKLPDADPLDSSYRQAFDDVAVPLLQQLDQQPKLFAGDVPSTST
jgi:murein DD-endopeptidase MepM/ murein hydrolase activator NlpD